ncbi:MAG: glycosyltransferase [Planctomycetota bacterium]
MNDPGDSLPMGFQGPVRAWSSLVPAAQNALLLPQETARFRGTDGAAAVAGELDLVEVRAVTESLGRIEDALAALAGRLGDGGTLLLDVDNAQSLPALRRCLEGRPGPFDPAGSLDDPSQVLPLRRVLQATAGAGLVVHDVVRVQTTAPELGPEFARQLFARGLAPLDWLQGPPPARFWLTCTKGRPRGGSVLVAGGDAAAIAAPLDCVRAFLPADWEILTSQAHRECAQWNRAVAAARGEIVWFLRGGSLPRRELFEAMSARAGIGAVVPGIGDEPARPGDVNGLMMPRLDALFVGPLPENIANSAVAVEEWGMRMGGRLPAPQIVAGELLGPEPGREAPATFAAEVAALFERWQPVDERRPATTSTTDAAPAAPPPPWHGRAPRVSLCMIARDEERFLADCLARAKDAVDEIIVVDTGSKDRTVAIAESFGAKVLHEPWQDDFSAPRNTALRAATGDWILVLDADEFLTPGAAERIRELVQDPLAAGYHLHFVNLYTDGRTLGVMMVRLFRNLPGLAYENVIHEQVTPSLTRAAQPLGLLLLSAEIVVEHHGYSDAVMDARGKNERNERLFRKQMARRPDDVYTHYKYGDFLRRVPGRTADARALLDRCLELILAGGPDLPRELPYAGEVAALCALEAARAGETARARSILDHALRRFMPTPNLYYLSASLALSDGRAEDAIAYYRRCLGYRDQVLVVPIQEGITSYVSLAGIAQCWMLRGDFERAERLLQQAVAIEPSYEVAQLALSRLCLQRGDAQEALRVLTTFLTAHPDSPGACQQTALILHRLGQTSQAKRMGKHAVGLLEARALDREAAEMNRILAAM